MKRVIGLMLALVLVATASAQKSSSEQAMGLVERTYAAGIEAAKSMWNRLQKEGKPMAQKMLKAAPGYYKSTQVTLQDFVKRVNQAEIPKTFREKQQLALEFWKLRGAINVLALSDPQIVKNLINLAPADVSKMQKDLRDSEVKLKKANLPGI